MSSYKNLCLLIAVVFFCTSLAHAAPIPRSKFNFNSSWKLAMGDIKDASQKDFDDSDWRPVTLPRAFNEDDAFKKEIHELGTGVAWYRKHFKLPAGWQNKKVIIEFEGARQAAEVYLNGRYVGMCENGVMAFGFDLSDQLLFGGADNVIAVRVDNSWNYKEKATGTAFQWNNANFYANYGGINKNVYLHVFDRLYQTLPLYSSFKTTGVYVYADNFDIKGHKANITAEAEVKNDYATPQTFGYEVDVNDAGGKNVAHFNGGNYTLAAGKKKTIKAGGVINNLNFWSWGYGYLYTVKTTLKVNGVVADQVQTKTGFRKTAFKNGMVYLNDRVLQMKGYAQRTTNEWPAVGSAVPAWMSDLSNRMMVESSGNLVRWMHVTPWKQDVESCDRVGLIQSMPAGDAEGDPKGRQWEQRLELMRDAMIYNRNNPSIMFYESGNHGVSEEHMKDMKALRDEFDPFGGRASGSREMLDSKIAEYGGEMLYINKSARIPFWAMEYSRDEGLRTYWDEYTPPFHKEGAGPKRKEEPGAYNHNQDAFAKEDVARWYDYWHERPGTGKRVSSGGVNIVFSDSNTHFRGEENYRTSGEVDALRIAKDGYFAHQVMWDGWVDPNAAHIYIIGHWNYTKGVTKDIYVVSGGDKVELFVNGKSKGYGHQSSRFLYTFKNISWEPGMIKAISYNAKGVKLSEAMKQTAGIPAALKLTVHTGPGGLKADGADMALVDVEVVDSKGNRCPTAMDSVSFTLEGPAEWRGGLAHGRADNYILAKTLPVACGINRVILRSLPQNGSIVLRAQSGKLKSASATIISQPFLVTDGRANFIPGEDLTANLQRGPTPAGPSYKMSRTSVVIANVTAGSNQTDAQNSYDDNERTSWTNDGTLANGWIKYDFDKPHKISEVTMKLNGWRSKRYPISILVDGKEVYRGVTQQSLGYVTIPLKATVGKSLTVKLTGADTDKDAFGLVEVSGKKEPDSVDGQKGKAGIGINEMEIYE